MANGGYWESEAAWRRVEAPLIDIDEVIDQFASIHGLPVTRNLKHWPERSIRWGTGIERLIQLYLADEAALTFNLWICAWQDRGVERYWKHETPIESQRVDQFKDVLATTLDDGYARLQEWSERDLEFGTRLGR